MLSLSPFLRKIGKGDWKVARGDTWAPIDSVSIIQVTNWLQVARRLVWA
jgi:hypothetical protein